MGVSTGDGSKAGTGVDFLERNFVSGNGYLFRRVIFEGLGASDFVIGGGAMDCF